MISKIAGELNAEMMKGCAERQATPRDELERQIMSCLEPKNEREHWAAREIEHLRDQLATAQARIDELMLEYCPDEMTEEQLAEYAKHQRATTLEEARAKGEKNA